MATNKFHHEQIYRGDDLIKKLEKVHITVCGCGAIGSNLIESLVRQGCSKIRVIDMDRVDTHNLNTQIFEEVDVGALKVSACEKRVYKSVGVSLETEDKKLTSSNIKKFLKGTQLVIDAFDNNESRKLLYDYCKENKIQCLHAGLHADYGEVAWNDVYHVPADTEGDVCDYPLARNLVSLVVAITCEEVIDFCLQKVPRFKNWCVTLKDLKIGNYN